LYINGKENLNRSNDKKVFLTGTEANRFSSLNNRQKLIPEHWTSAAGYTRFPIL